MSCLEHKLPSFYNASASRARFGNECARPKHGRRHERMLEAERLKNMPCHSHSVSDCRHDHEQYRFVSLCTVLSNLSMATPANNCVLRNETLLTGPLRGTLPGRTDPSFPFLQRGHERGTSPAAPEPHQPEAAADAPPDGAGGAPPEGAAECHGNPSGLVGHLRAGHPGADARRDPRAHTSAPGELLGSVRATKWAVLRVLTLRSPIGSWAPPFRCLVQSC